MLNFFKSKEQLYDEHISPIVRKLLDECTKHNIQVIAVFDIGEKQGGQFALAAVARSDHELFNHIAEHCTNKTIKEVAESQKNLPH